MSKVPMSMASTFQWLLCRVAVIYVVLFLFCITCVDLKTLDMRIKTRRLNGAIPDFTEMIVFSKEHNAKKILDWKPYKNYFTLVLSYLPDDVLTKNLLGFVDFYSGDESQAVALFKSSAQINGQSLFWPNYNLGVIYYKKGMWPQAADYLFKAIASNPKLTLLLMQNSIIYRQIFISPYFTYSLNDEISDAQSHAYILLLSSLNFMKQYEKMVLISNLAIANKDLSYKDAYYYYAGLGFFEEGQMEKAFLLFQKSLTIEKNNPDVYIYMANIYQNAGQLEQARDLVQLSYALHQKNDPRFPYDAHVDLCFF
jgi:tetratricopeptide (TPR) repeat protein